LHAEGYCWSRTSERQVLRIRYLYLQAILRQEAGFFDSQDQDQVTTSEIINSISKDASDIQEVLSEKVQYCRHTTIPNPSSHSFTSSLVIVRIQSTKRIFSSSLVRRQKDQTKMTRVRCNIYIPYHASVM
jgi:ABC-type multidrug transport system fused ATPase/permease subunit